MRPEPVQSLKPWVSRCNQAIWVLVKTVRWPRLGRRMLLSPPMTTVSRQARFTSACFLISVPSRSGRGCQCLRNRIGVSLLMRVRVRKSLTSSSQRMVWLSRLVNCSTNGRLSVSLSSTFAWTMPARMSCWRIVFAVLIGSCIPILSIRHVIRRSIIIWLKWDSRPWRIVAVL